MVGNHLSSDDEEFRPPALACLWSASVQDSGLNEPVRSWITLGPTANGKAHAFMDLLNEFLTSHRGSSVLAFRPAPWPQPHQQHARVRVYV